MESVRGRSGAWWTRWVPGVCSTVAIVRSTRRGRRRRAWANRPQADEPAAQIATASGGGPEHERGRRADDAEHHDVERVLAQRRGHVDVRIGVMRPVQAPQDGHRWRHR